MDRIDAAATARNMMVDSQVRPNRVLDPRVIEAMRTLPRERFVPPRLAGIAYVDEDLPLGFGRALMEPMVIARLVQLAEVREGEHALVVAAGSGYGAALLAACGARVIALESKPELAELARDALAAHGHGAVLVAGPVEAGWPRGAPYDVILIEGAVEQVPPAILAQLKPAHAGGGGGGRLVTVMMDRRIGRGGVGEVAHGKLAFSAAFDCGTPVLPEFRTAAGFVF